LLKEKTVEKLVTQQPKPAEITPEEIGNGITKKG